MTRLLLAGASFEALALARDLGHDVVAVADPACQENDWRGLAAFASDRDAISAGGFEAVVIAIDDPRARQVAQVRYEQSGIAIADLLGAEVGENTIYGSGLFLQRQAHLSVDGKLGNGVRMNVGANVMHDAAIGDFVTIAPHALVLGRVTVGTLSYIGANATILPDITIGTNCVIGAGAVVTTDVPGGQVVKGNPAQ